MSLRDISASPTRYRWFEGGVSMLGQADGPEVSTLSLSEAKARLDELARLAHGQHERFTLTRNGTPEAVLLSVDDLEGLETTVEVLADRASVAAIAEALAEIERGERGVPLDQLRRPSLG